MTQETISVLRLGDSHMIQFPRDLTLAVDAPPHCLTVMLHPLPAGAGFLALESVVTFPDGRVGLNPILATALQRWPRINIQDLPATEGATVRKHLMLSLGTSLSAYDPVINYTDRGAIKYVFSPDIDFVLPSRPDLQVNPSCALVPVALLRELYGQFLDPLRQALALLAEDYPDRIWILGCPPPAETNDVLQKKFDSITGEAGPRIQLPSPIVALKLWLLVNQCVRDICTETGVRFLDCTPVACDARGFLRPEFVLDGVHGNVHYNKILAQHIAAETASAEIMKPR